MWYFVAWYDRRRRGICQNPIPLMCCRITQLYSRYGAWPVILACFDWPLVPFSFQWTPSNVLILECGYRNVRNSGASCEQYSNASVENDNLRHLIPVRDCDVIPCPFDGALLAIFESLCILAKSGWRMSAQKHDCSGVDYSQQRIGEMGNQL